MIVPRATADGFAPGPITGWWPHGFNLRQLVLATGAYIRMHARHEVEVLFVQQGTVEIRWADGALILGAGDTLSVPVGLPRAFRNTASGEGQAVRGARRRGSGASGLPVGAARGLIGGPSPRGLEASSTLVSRTRSSLHSSVMLNLFQHPCTSSASGRTLPESACMDPETRSGRQTE